ncbi:MAG: type IV pilin protein [Luteibacter sp.]|jgi:type IV pilus assembly protein PilE|uniref:type IV pilin protein n=1 Tax=unclassified Luteibacter TaxID=2620188 RepID=UPI0005BDC6F6|nr:MULTISPECIES: type IV pilin protein [unclassified Luteibacter]MDQ7996151.1 type IV pilin protein [Luteibacter sp.]MDQ8048846.1 type IV pilin protein [Luteibacter sp.]
MTSNSRRYAGYTLIELMIVVAVIAVLAMIAIPSYTRYAYRARRSDGQQLLMRVANAQERYYSTFNTYGGEPVTGDLKLGSVTSEKGYYTVVITSTDLTKNYTATVNPTNAQQRDVCGALSIDSRGNKLPAASDTAKNSNGNCW